MSAVSDLKLCDFVQVIGATDIISNVLHPNSDDDGDAKGVIDDIITHFVKAGSTFAKNPEVEVFKFSEALFDIDVSLHFVSHCLWPIPHNFNSTSNYCNYM